jgi:putative ABC transport system permease protein
VVAQGTARRTREIGIRMAWGTTAGTILQLVVTRGMRQLMLGLVLGLIGAAAATRLLDQVGFLIQVSPHDPMAFAAVVARLMAIGVLACWLPAPRATRIDPTDALRSE